MLICYQEKNFRAKSLQLIAMCNTILKEMRAEGYILTLRQLYYQLVSDKRVMLPNNEKSYDNVGALISDARLAGLIDWDAIVDRTRSLRALSHWENPSDIIEGAAQQFNYDRWADQGTRVEVWVEKDALVDVVGQAAKPYDVPYFSCRGYTSQSEMWGASQRLLAYHEAGQDVVILHLGDHDPSGLDMTRDIRERLAMFSEQHGWDGPTVNRIALNMAQVRQYNPPPNPAKLTDCRVHKYIAEYGHESWELDALSPKVVDALIQKHIKQNMDNELFEAATARQDRARAEIAQIADNYADVINALNKPKKGKK